MVIEGWAIYDNIEGGNLIVSSDNFEELNDRSY
jgi:hypothetical protein